MSARRSLASRSQPSSISTTDAAWPPPVSIRSPASTSLRHLASTQLIDDVFEMMERLFALDDEAKLLINKAASPHFRGWESVGSEFTNNRVDVREQIDMWSEWPAATPTATPGAAPIESRLLGPNPWMPDDILAGHRELTLRWMSELGRLADRILEILALGLGLERDHSSSMFGDRPMSLTKMIHYPPTPAGGAGVNAHHDTGFLTLLAPGPNAGLQVLNPTGDWIGVPTVPGTFVVNLGEMLQAITGNYFAATAHRVIATQERLSAAYFHGPSLDTALTPLRLAPTFAAAVQASERHRTTGFMASSERHGRRRRRHGQRAGGHDVRRTALELLRAQLSGQHGPASPQRQDHLTERRRRRGLQVGESHALEGGEHCETGPRHHVDHMGHRRGAASGCHCRGHARRGVLDGDAVRRIHTQKGRSRQVRIGSGLAVGDLVTGDRPDEHTLWRFREHCVGEAPP
jgi:isopenicillin N synthase-like dioxygenase